MSKISLFIFIILFTQNPVELQEYKLAEETAEKLIEETKSALMKKLAEAGPPGAIEECSRIAIEIAKQKEKENWRVRRVSFRFRNPLDRPDEYEEKVLKEFEELKSENKLKPDFVKSEIVIEGDKKFLRYMKPITIPGEMCLRCHGEDKDISEDVKRKLKELYPGDRAVGYRVGDLRGAVSIKIPLDK